MAQASDMDLLILGSGSTAFAASLRAQEFGKIAVMIEDRTIGGSCVNRGWLPSKNLIEAAKLMRDARHPRYPGLGAAELRLDFRKLIEQKDEVVHSYREKKYDSLVGGKFRIERGHARFVDPHTVEETATAWRPKDLHRHRLAAGHSGHRRLGPGRYLTSEFVDMLHGYPTMAEALKIGAIARYKDPAKLSWCAE